VPIHSALTLFPEEFDALVTERAERRHIPVTASSITAEPAGATA
jgi:hypothetical protein